MDSERIAELKHDKEEIPESILERAREELREKALDGLTFDVVLEALSEMPGQIKFQLIDAIKADSVSLSYWFISDCVKKYLEPSQESVQQRAEEILAEMDYRKGEDI